VSKYVLFGIPEDIGIRAILVTWRCFSLDSAIKKYCYPAQSILQRKPTFILGQLNVSAEMKGEHLDFNDIDDRSKLSQGRKIDKDVSHIILILN
jgi:formiminoglutamase